MQPRKKPYWRLSVWSILLIGLLSIATLQCECKFNPFTDDDEPSRSEEVDDQEEEEREEGQEGSEEEQEQGGQEESEEEKKKLTEITNEMIEAAKSQHKSFLAQQLARLQQEDQTNDNIPYINDLGGFEKLTALHEASDTFFKRPDIVQALLERGADPNQKNAVGHTPLYTAVFCEPDNSLVTIGLLLDAGADPMNGTEPPLKLVIGNEQPESTKLLLTKVSDVNVQDADGNTPLHWAVDTSHASDKYVSIIQALLNKGARIDIKNKSGKTPQDMAEYKGNTIRILLGWPPK